MPGYLGTEGEPDDHTIEIQGQQFKIDMLGISGPGWQSLDTVDNLEAAIRSADALISLVEPAKPQAVTAMESMRFECLGHVVREEKAARQLTESLAVLLWDTDDENAGDGSMTVEEQREAGRVSAREFVGKAGEGVDVHFAHARSGEGILEAVEATVTKLLENRESAMEEQRRIWRAEDAQAAKEGRWWRRLLRGKATMP